MIDRFKLVTALSPEECALRLTAAIDYESYDLSRLKLDFGGSKPVIGEVITGRFILQKRIGGHNSFSTYAVGNIEAAENGTIISGTFSTHPGFQSARKIWGCCAIFIGLPILCTMLYDLFSGVTHLTDLRDGRYEARLPILGILIFIALLYSIGRLSAEGEDGFLLSFLQQVLEAHPA